MQKKKSLCCLNYYMLDEYKTETEAVDWYVGEKRRINRGRLCAVAEVEKQ